MKLSLNSEMKKRILALILTVQVLCLCCVFSACATAQAKSSAAETTAPTAAAVTDSLPKVSSSRPLHEQMSVSVMTRSRWLSDMMTALGLIGPDEAPYDSAGVFAAAYEAGITDSPEGDPSAVLTRSYAASTIVSALGYSPRVTGPVADLGEDDADLMTLVYYGWFIPDENDLVYPDDSVTDREYERLLDELRCYAVLNGKRLLSFGDSIMYGTGNDGDGITDLIAEKYGMSCADYAVSGATFGVYKNRSHIADQVRNAAYQKDTADVIFLNGGTNDAVLCAQGSMSAGFSLSMFDEDTFSGGMEAALALIREYWQGVPVIYIRPHNMALCDDSDERLYGEYAKLIADKWSAASVDIYEDTVFNAEDEVLRNKYTFFNQKHKRADSIHPTALGYAKYYLPLVSEQLRATVTGGGD